MTNPSLSLTARDFDAYRAEKATSNAYSRPRLEVKQRALAWGRRVVERLSALGIAVDIHASDEHPSIRNKKRVECQWVFFWRDHEAREELDRLLDQGRSISAAIDDPSPYTRHAFLALRLDPEAVEVCFAAHPEAKVDVDNLRARLATAGAPGEAKLADELTSALRALPEEFMIGLGREDRARCEEATAEVIGRLLERAAAGQTPLWIGWTVPRETALAHADTIDEQLEDAITALAPIYRLIAWSRENDHIALDRRIEGLEQEKARTHAEALAENERWRAQQEAQRERSQKEAQARLEEAARRSDAAGFRGAPPPGKRPTLDALFKPKGAAAGARHEAHGGHREAKRDAAGPKQPDLKPSAHTQPKEAPAESRASAPAPSGAIEKGATVRVLSGAFARKVGVVAELDGRGGARVLLGLLSTRLDMSDLELAPEDRERREPTTSSKAPTAAAAAPRKNR